MNTDCNICKNTCYDFGNTYINVCVDCAVEIYKIRDKISGINHITISNVKKCGGEGFSKRNTATLAAIEQFRVIYNNGDFNKSVSSVDRSQDKPCKQCSKSCSPGDAKCWWCECPSPC